MRLSGSLTVSKTVTSQKQTQERGHTGIADTNWELLHRLNKTDVDLYLADRAAKGFPVVQTVIFSQLNATSILNFRGALAMQHNEDYFSYVDWVVTHAASTASSCVLSPRGRAASKAVTCNIVHHELIWPKEIPGQAEKSCAHEMDGVAAKPTTHPTHHLTQQEIQSASAKPAKSTKGNGFWADIL